jgi:SNF2 family DNA or RNA helicase
MCRRDTRKDEIISVSNVAEINDSPKIYEIVKIIKEFNEKFIIFSQFDILDKFHTLLNKKNIKTQKYTEYVNSKLANPDVESDTKVLLLSSGSNAEGINLSMFDRLVIFEPFEDHMYCREIEKQLIGRIHRVGRVKPVNVYRLITKNTIEEEIYMNV